ncbi:MAG: signal peptidase II [Lachnospiraceae bacterium]|nr:signal peptidase II [Lachnospiraceae bacterium]
MLENSKKKSIILGFVAFILLTVFDQLTKLWAVNTLKDKEALVIIEGVFKLRYLENNGAAFSLLEGQQMFFFIITVAMLILFAVIFYKIPMGDRYRYLRWICVFLEAGALGNLIDRMRLEYVVDFFYFELIDFPTFNVADIYITVSMFFFVVLILFYYKEDEFDFLKRKKIKA